MGAFLDAVRQDRVPGPLRRQFKLSVWDNSFSTLRGDVEDENVHLAGRILYKKAEVVRKLLKMTFSEHINATTKIRAFVALANRDTLILQEKVCTSHAALTDASDLVVLSDLAAIRLPLQGGHSFSPDEIIQSIVDGGQVSIKVVLGLKQSLSGSANFKKLDWKDLVSDFNLGNLYQQLEQLWDDCLWNDYRVDDGPVAKLFMPRDPFWSQLHAASRARQSNLMMEFFGRARAHLKQLVAEGRNPLFGSKEVKSIEKVGRRKIVRFSSSEKLSEHALSLQIARAYASEPYYSNLLEAPQQGLGGGSLNELISAWHVVVQCSELLIKRMGTEEPKLAPAESNSLNDFAPVLQRDALRRAIHESVGVDYKRSGYLLDFLTYRADPAQELWAQPLVLVNVDSLAPLFAAARYADLLRLVDVWLRQLGVDMQARGPAFEAYVRTELKEQISASPLLSGAKVLEKEFVLRPTIGRDEEIDILVVLGNLVLVGEAKCSVPPTDAKAYALHRKMVEKATAQVNRKAQAVEANRDLFRTRLAELGVEVPEAFIVLPVVILNAAFHAGMAVGSVPVVDLYILSVFFSGKLVEVAKGQDMVPVRERILYLTVEEAVSEAAGILRAPPQLELFVRGLREQQVKIQALAPDDWAGEYTSFDCIVDASHLTADHRNGLTVQNNRDL